MIKAVLDVNILVSAALNEQGLPARVADLAFDGVYELVISTHVRRKVTEVFGRPYLLEYISSAARKRILEALEAGSEPIDPDPSVSGIAPDLEDDLVLGTAVAASADFHVTGDNGLLALKTYRGIQIVMAGEFLDAKDQS